MYQKLQLSLRLYRIQSLSPRNKAAELSNTVDVPPLTAQGALPYLGTLLRSDVVIARSYALDIVK